MNAYGLLLVVIMKIKTEKSLPLEKFNISECKNITTDMTIKNGIISEVNSSIFVKMLHHRLLT